jgi:hypothetical protein
LALAVFTSTFSSLLVRGSVAFLSCVVPLLLPEIVHSEKGYEVLLSDPVSILTPVLSLCSILVYYFLTLAAARVAPVADSYALRKRILALALMGIVGVMLYFGIFERSVFGLGGLLIGGLVVDATFENRPEWRSALRVFSGGTLRRALSRVFEPTWQSGCLFALCAVVLYGLVLYFLGQPRTGHGALFCVASASMILFPAALARTFRTPVHLAPLWFIGVHLVNIIGALLVDALSGSGYEARHVVLLFPDVQIVYAIVRSPVDGFLRIPCFSVSTVLTGGSILLLVLAHRSETMRGISPREWRDASQSTT